MTNIPVYCFIDSTWGSDVTVIAVCGACGEVIGQHVSSNEDWARHDITREYHQREYYRHMEASHDAADCATEWVDNATHHEPLQAFIRQYAQEQQQAKE